jgi:hypothetical protein
MLATQSPAAARSLVQLSSVWFGGPDGLVWTGGEGMTMGAVPAQTRIRWFGAVVAATLLAALVLPAGSVRARGSTPVRGLTATMSYKLIHAIVSQTAIYGSTIIWTQTVPPEHGAVVPESLYSSPLADIVKHRIFSFPQGTAVIKLATSQKWVVASLSGAAGSSLWAFNRLGRYAKTIDSWAVTGGMTLSGFALDGDQVTYVVDTLGKNSGNGTFAVRTMTLPHGATSTVITRFVKCGQIQIAGMNGDSLLGSLSRGCDGSDVVAIDPGSGAVAPLTSNDRSTGAFTNGTIGGWIRAHLTEQGLSTSGTIMLQRPRSGGPVPISVAASAEASNCKVESNGVYLDRCASSPGATSKLAYWLDGTGEANAYDLASHGEMHIATSQPPSIAGLGQGYGAYLTWPSSVSQPTPGQPESWIVVAHIHALGAQTGR